LVRAGLGVVKRGKGVFTRSEAKSGVLDATKEAREVLRDPVDTAAWHTAVVRRPASNQRLRNPAPSSLEALLEEEGGTPE
jgi:hypothetical protein